MPHCATALILTIVAWVGDAMRVSKVRAPDSQVKTCYVSPHTYINLGDGGCFQHLDAKGEFKDSASGERYKESFCPFVSNPKRRRALMAWHSFATENPEETFRLLRPPISVNDIAMSCLIDDINKVRERYAWVENYDGERYSLFEDIDSGVWSSEEMCETMLSLPLMFEAIGFDGPGIVMEDSRTSSRLTFKGNKVMGGGLERSGPTEGCDSMMATNLGPARLGRLALRALLPTYFRHRYAESGTGMYVKGIRALVSPFTRFSTSYWKKQVKEVCDAAATPATLQELYSFTNFRAGKLVSKDAMDRDRGRCHEAIPCNYAPDPEQHLGACDVCSPEEPWFQPHNGLCTWEKSDRFEAETCADESVEKRTCECHKAICWYFTRDFKAAMKVAAKACANIK